jgi:tetratricopeptide (TPR) repeat protein
MEKLDLKKLIDNAIECRNRNAHSEAIKCISIIIENFPLIADYFDFRSHQYILIKNFDKAIEDLDQAIKLNSANYMYYSTKAYLFFENKNYKEAIKLYEKALTLKPASHHIYQVYNDLGCSKLNYYLSSNHEIELLDSAIEDFTYGLTLNPSILVKSDFFERRAYCNYLKGINIYNSGDGIQAQINGDGTASFINNFEPFIKNALIDYYKAKEINPNRAEIFYKMSICYEVLRDEVKELENISIALKLDPNNEQYINIYNKLLPF